MRFLFDGQRINPESTPEEARVHTYDMSTSLLTTRHSQLEMEDSDCVDCVAPNIQM